MNTSTPFAKLGHLNKSGSDLFATGNELADLGVDMAAGSNPFTGLPYYGAKMVDDFRQGNILSGLGNAAWGGLSFVGGTALGKGLLGGGKIALKTGAKGLAARTAQAGSNALTKGTQAINAAAQGTGAVASGARGLKQYNNFMHQGQNFANRQVGRLANGLVGKPMVSRSGWKLGTTPMSQSTARTTAVTGLYAGNGLIAPSNVTTAPTAPSAPKSWRGDQSGTTKVPAWYTQATGSTQMPDFNNATPLR